MKVTISDVARRAGVSKSTVSRVMNDSPGVGEETRVLVLGAGAELGYQPSAVARSLSTGRTKVIGLVISDITNPFFPDVARGVEDVCATYDYNVILCNTDNRPGKEEAHVRVLSDKGVDGIVFTSVRMGETNLEGLRRRGIPFVLAGRTLEGCPAWTVEVDNFLGGCLATEHLIHLGHRDIAFVAGPPGVSSAEQRLAGYQQALARNQLRFDPSQVYPGDFRHASGLAAAAALCADRKPPTAVFAANDFTAVGLLEGLLNLGLNVPGDISVVGFDDIALAGYPPVNLTTVSQPRYDLGATAARLLIRLIELTHAGRREAETGVASQIVLVPKLVVRGTTAPPRPESIACGAP
ncbi:MAG: LacI family DNA-binding transcriptional regulator [Methanocella sp.]